MNLNKSLFPACLALDLAWRAGWFLVLGSWFLHYLSLLLSFNNFIICYLTNIFIFF
jgi:hypothetical protein